MSVLLYSGIICYMNCLQTLLLESQKFYAVMLPCNFATNTVYAFLSEMVSFVLFNGYCNAIHDPCIVKMV